MPSKPPSSTTNVLSGWGNPPNGRPPIEKTSALVVYAFSKWPDGLADPLDTVDKYDLIETGRALEGNPGLCIYVEGNAAPTRIDA
ncbi:hypothetical protein [Methylotenera sp.]|uniref:hypothetical protein n=1 Tax=Methylotenera sp. TaxID=2051956 RepID=UPI0027272DFC|nr:hypothetical protein [Methylotenera sp.]MDO9204149.1 hypothetical protein [Methylotenera sp.]MDP1522346.1 hypothetical protein [Methylotenera sp.]MDP2072580.1 hypothetical protein [Methylotenera sp.]MDP3006049.1 hypothetical protein [Methylotenera sp.]MDP3819166.1 hypothetical protein [Methylotenera sp.]